jgi:aerobic carbon-monoxide dehydrogenase small subunit
MTARMIRFTLNGRPVSAAVEPHHNLIELLRQFDLSGARESCGQGLCGCCTVLVDDEAVSGCLYFAVRLDGRTVSTVEHLDAGGQLSKLQQAFMDCGGSSAASARQASSLMSHQLLARNPHPSEQEIRDYLSGN